jgi:hypothetical protein
MCSSVKNFNFDMPASFGAVDLSLIANVDFRQFVHAAPPNPAVPGAFP